MSGGDWVRYPAAVHVLDTSENLLPVKVYKLGDTVHAYAVRSGGVVEVARLEDVQSVENVAGGRVLRIEAADGQVWEVVKGSGCGCGSPLKRYDPRSKPHEALARR